MEKKLQVRNLRISFRTVSGKLQAVRDISFDLHKGETLAIVGESGSGKSVTSKAILGISAGNAITEGGEILYDGQDLLKITEDDFYRLRGDKIAMIFQDPLSSLNPIMRVGKQLTEAMILKGKARQRSSKKEYESKMALLEKAMVESQPAEAELAKKACENFGKLTKELIILEQPYFNSRDRALEAQEHLRYGLFLLERNAFDRPQERLKNMAKTIQDSFNPYVLTDEKARSIAAALPKHKKDTIEQLKLDYAYLYEAINKALEKEEPDFMAIAYQKAKGETVENTKEAHQRYRQEFESNFQKEFLGRVAKALEYNDAEFDRRCQAAIEAIDEARRQLGNSSVEEYESKVAPLCSVIDSTIDSLATVKDSACSTFSGSMRHFITQLHDGKKNNAARQRKYDAQLGKLERRRQKGKPITYTPVAPTIVDFDLLKDNMMLLMQRLKENYAERLRKSQTESKYDKAKILVNYLQDNAAAMAYEVTPASAKIKAIKLLEEVGIPEPHRRYNQYPFEFSGGMRQRIVIAIALAANPDILICDEPTTALDVTIQAQILELINKLKKERDLSIIFITHDLGVVANMADRIAVMYAGKIVEYGTAEEVFYEPAHPYTWALLGSMPDLETKDELEAIPGTPPNMIYPPKGDAFADRNKYAMQIDFEEHPPCFDITPTHWAATWLLHPDAPKVERPAVITERVRKMKERLEAAQDE